MIGVFLCSAVFSQDAKSWSGWSNKDADKILNNSAWGQSLMKGEAPIELRVRNAGNPNPQLGDPGPVKVPSEIYLRVRFITAKPIREAFASKIWQSQPDPTPELKEQLQTIVDNGFGDLIVVAVNVEGQNPQTVRQALQGLMRLKTEELADKVYLERNDKKRLPLVEYRIPSADNMGGKFIFARSLDGGPFLTPETDSVRFVMNLSDNLKINLKFSVSKMMYGDKLEY
ncbi:MAG: hypothetical protein ABIV48_01110 [Pyrinomonadaceae bacterium]